VIRPGAYKPASELKPLSICAVDLGVGYEICCLAAKVEIDQFAERSSVETDGSSFAELVQPGLSVLPCPVGGR